MSHAAPNSLNGLVMPPDFPVAEYEAINRTVLRHATTAEENYAPFASAWNALAYRFVAVTEYETALTASLGTFRAAPIPLERYRQERDLFGFFSNGFSVFEASFYAMFSIGAFLSPANFPITTPKDQQKISPSSTAVAFAKSFAGTPSIR
jgi:hypothetical protein